MYLDCFIMFYYNVREWVVREYVNDFVEEMRRVKKKGISADYGTAII